MRGWLVVIMALPLIGRAQEPCRDDGDRVSCTKPGFTTLVKTCRKSQLDAETCDLALKAANDKIQIIEAEIVECRDPCPPCPPQKVQSGTWQALGYALGIVGTAATLAAPMFPQMGLPAQLVTATTGVAMIGVGFVVNLSFD